MISKKFIIDYLNTLDISRNEDVIDLADILIAFLDPYIESCNMAVMAINTKRKIVIVNNLTASLFGISEKNLIDAYADKILPKSPCSVATVKNFKSLPKQFQFLGKTIYAERALIPNQENPAALISFMHEIKGTEKMTERSNLSSSHEAFLNDIIENSYDGIYITDKEGKTILVNKAYERISGISRDTLVGEYMSNLVNAGILSTSLTDEVVSSKETVTRTQTNQNNKEVMITGSPIFDEFGNVSYIITNVRDVTELINLNTKLQAESSRANLYQEIILQKAADSNIAYGSREFENVLNISRKISKMDSTVLILGETGVGKEIIAQYIHKNSLRHDKPYIKINCGAIPANLLESELFGYVPGAFTGASNKGKPGLFELADTGTLFLDEIGELPINLQSSLLRVLQDGEVTRVGGSKSNKVDVRIITATNRDLESMIEDGTFRSDLYYRLNVVSVNIPPLRQRKADIPFLAEKTIKDLNKKYNMEKALSPNFVQHLTEMEWPGNIRELKNYIEKQFVLSDGNIIDNAPMLQTYPVSPLSERATGSDEQKSPLPTYAEAKEAMEKDLFRRAMEEGKSTYKAASLLNMSQSTFFRKYKDLFHED